MRISRQLACAALAVAAACAPVTRRLMVDQGRFVLDRHPTQIISGEMHYARVPREYWRARLRMARAMGLNTISTYVFWNLHEPEPGRYDFMGQRDIVAFIRTAQEEGLNVILRPGPYVCAEWDLGGYPAWLLADTALVLRSIDPRFTAPAERWLVRLGRELRPVLRGPHAPVVAVQVENEYGSFGRDTAYMAWQRDALRRAGFGHALMYTADGDVQLPYGTLPGLPAVVNFGVGGADSAFARLARFRPGQPLMSGEYWAGWFDQWGGPHARTNTDRQERELAWILQRGYSVNLYMFHGGTTFGFMNGANVDRNRYLPQTSSYDYDAALDEAGHPTPKYFAFREIIAAAVEDDSLPAVPPVDSTIAIPAFRLDEVAPLWSMLGRPVHMVQPRSMEQLGQAYGYILYRTHAPRAGRATLRVRDVRDYVQIYVNGALAGTIDRRLAQDSLEVSVPAAGAQLDLLVENGGRVNFTSALRTERKGITTPVTLGGEVLTNWDVYPLPFSTVPRPSFITEPFTGPALFRGTFDLARTGDTFLDTRGWGKGTVWVNGHHLGRFWNIGPQQTLYVPGPWLRQGRNEVIVLDLDVPATRTMAGLRTAVFEVARAPAN